MVNRWMTEEDDENENANGTHVRIVDVNETNDMVEDSGKQIDIFLKNDSSFFHFCLYLNDFF